MGEKLKQRTVLDGLCKHAFTYRPHKYYLTQIHTEFGAENGYFMHGGSLKVTTNCVCVCRQCMSTPAELFTLAYETQQGAVYFSLSFMLLCQMLKNGLYSSCHHPVGWKGIGLKLWPNVCVWVNKSMFWVSKLTWGTITSETHQSAFWETQCTLDQKFTWFLSIGNWLDGKRAVKRGGINMVTGDFSRQEKLFEGGF